MNATQIFVKQISCETWNAIKNWFWSCVDISGTELIIIQRLHHITYICIQYSRRNKTLHNHPLNAEILLPINVYMYITLISFPCASFSFSLSLLSSISLSLGSCFILSNPHSAAQNLAYDLMFTYKWHYFISMTSERVDLLTLLQCLFF